MKLIPPNIYPDLIALINETYTDDVEQILSAGVDDEGDITCLAQDGNKQLAIKITDDDIQIKLFNPQAVTGQTAQMAASENITLDFVDRAVDKLRQQFPFKPWLQQAKELLMQSSSLEDYSASLVDLYPEMPSDDFNQIMLDAMTAGSMAGYFDAETEMDAGAEFKMLEGTTRQKNGRNQVLRDSRWRRDADEDPEKKNYKVDIGPTHMSVSDDVDLTQLMRYSDGSWRGLFGDDSGDVHKFDVPENLSKRAQDLANNPTQERARELMTELQPTKDRAKRATAIDRLTTKFQKDVADLPPKSRVDVIRPLGEKYIKDLMDLNDRDTASGRAWKIEFEESVGGSKAAEVQDQLTDFFQLIDKDLDIESVSIEGDRSFARESTNKIGLSEKSSKRYGRECVFHEAAHFIEFKDSELGEANEEWVNDRASGDAKSLKELCPRAGYDDDEIAFPDKFIDPYVGKYYGDMTTEVYSMGLERFSDGRKVVDFLKKDPDHFSRIIDYIKK